MKMKMIVAGIPYIMVYLYFVGCTYTLYDGLYTC